MHTKVKELFPNHITQPKAGDIFGVFRKFEQNIHDSEYYVYVDIYIGLEGNSRQFLAKADIQANGGNSGIEYELDCSREQQDLISRLFNNWELSLLIEPEEVDSRKSAVEALLKKIFCIGYSIGYDEKPGTAQTADKHWEAIRSRLVELGTVDPEYAIPEINSK